MTPTDEQVAALDAFATGGSVVVQALAGTGKTQTLLLMAGSTSRKGQYLAFSRALVVEAGEKFSDTSTACRTVHSLAYGAVGYQYRGRLNGPRMRSQEIARILGVEPIELPTGVGNERRRLAPGFLGSLAMQAVGRFCQSADDAPSGEHVPYVDGLDMPQPDGRKGWGNNRELRRYLAPFVTRAWLDLCQTKGRLRYDHAHYLKLWQLSDPVVSADFVLWDEVQDSSKVMESIVRQQANMQVIAVGDANQAIFEWLGAIDALTRFEEHAEKVCTLSQSFRFGPAVANVANVILGQLDTPLRVKGLPAIDSEVVIENGPNPTVPDAVLCRTNATSVRRVLEYRQDGRKVALVGDGKEVLSFARGAQKLQQTGSTDHPELACFLDWPSVRAYVAADPQGHELRLMVDLVDEFGTPIIEEALSGVCREENADVVVSTAHKSKGRQWPRVRIAEDFPVGTPDKPLPPAELRLQYVAVTRAQHVLDLSACPTLAQEVESA